MWPPFVVYSLAWNLKQYHAKVGFGWYCVVLMINILVPRARILKWYEGALAYRMPIWYNMCILPRASRERLTT